MKVIIAKVDMDTTLAALLLGVSAADDIRAYNGKVINNDLQDEQTVCIECGDSGGINRDNFDHHDTAEDLPPACQQAFEMQTMQDNNIARLVNYVCLNDIDSRALPNIEFPSLSNLFSGMLLEKASLQEQLLSGIELLKEILKYNLDPFKTIPLLPKWQKYCRAKRVNHSQTLKDAANARFKYTENGLKIGFLSTKAIGGLGILYEKGCDIAILHNPAYGPDAVNKYTIASQDICVAGMLPHLNSQEQGWGGHPKIIGSPRRGSIISPDNMLKLICSYCTRVSI